jgi:hypothetical protein
MTRMSIFVCPVVVILCAAQAETQEPKKKPDVTLTLVRVRGVEFFSTPLEGPGKGQKVRDVILACDVVIDNQTGRDITVLSNFFSAFDGLSIVVLKEGKELRNQSYLVHQSPNAEKRPYVLKKGRNVTDMRFPISDLPADWAGLEVKIIGNLPGSKVEEAELVSETRKIQRVKDLSK